MPRSQIKGGLLTLDLPLCGGGSHAFHSLYIKDHATAAGGGKTNTLFVGNIDYNASRMSHRDIDAYLRELFSPLGEVTSVSISSLDSGEDDDGEEQHAYISSSSSGSSSSSSSSLKSVTSQPSRFAHVQFAKSSAVKAILQAIKNGYFHEQAQQIGSRYGLGPQMAEKSHAELREAYALVDTDRDALKRKVDSFMRDFEEEEALARQQREKRSREADEDGFMPVQHRKKRKRQDGGGRKGGSSGTSATARPRSGKKKARLQPLATASITSSSAAASKGQVAMTEQNSDRTLKNFYSFQQKEEKQNTLLRLRQQFDEDKEKVARLKAQRKFKPF